MSTFLKINLISLLLLSLSSFANQEELLQRIDKLEEKLLELQIDKIDAPKVRISGEFSNGFQNLSIRDETQDIKRDDFSFAFSSLKLSFDYVELSNLKFYSNLRANYIWNRSAQTPRNTVDFIQDDFNGSLPFIEKAFFDYFFLSKKLAISAGRLPTQFGPPMHFSSNTERAGTYPANLYSLPLDGIAITANLGRFFGTKTRHILRFIANPIFNRDGGFLIESSGNSRSFFDNPKSDSSAFHVNYEVSRESSVGDFSMITQAVHIDIKNGGSFEQRGVLQSQASGSNLTDTNVYEIGSPDDSLATWQAAIAYFEWTNLFKTNFDLYASYKRSIVKRRGSLIAEIIEDNTGSALGTRGSQFDIGSFFYSSDQEASSVFVGSRYQWSNDLNFGLEYLKQSYGNIPTSIRSLNFLDFYNIIGEAYHVYINYQVNKQLNLNLSYVHRDAESEIVGVVFGSRPTQTNQLAFEARLSF